MGCQTSTVRDAKGSGKDELAVETEQEIRFNKRLTDKIKDWKIEESKGRRRRGSMMAGLLKFPKMRKGFSILHKSFDKLAKEEKGIKSISKESLYEAELFASIDKDDLKTFLDEADMNENEQLTFKEYVLFGTFVFLCGGQMDITVKSSLKKAVDVVVQFWRVYDSDHNGWVSAEEAVRVSPDAHGGMDKDADAFFTEERFREMDADNTGNVSFKEFLFALASWAGIGEDD